MSDMSGYIIIPEILPAHSHTMYSHGENMTMGVFSYKSCSFFYHQGRFGGQYSLFISLIEPINPLYQETNAKFPMYQSQILVRIRKPHRNHGKTGFFKKFRKKIRRAPPYASVTNVTLDLMTDPPSFVSELYDVILEFIIFSDFN